MDHLHDAAAGSGTLPGHLIPGLLFLCWGLCWAAQALSARGRAAPGEPLEAGLFVPIAKLAVLPIGTWFEMPGPGWYPMDQVMGWSHITIYMGFALSGLVDLLHRSGRIGPAATYIAFGGGALNAAFLFVTHGNHLGVETTAHTLLGVAFAASGVAALAEAARPHPLLRWLRTAAMTVVGSWFMVVGWMLFRSRWDLADPLSVLWVFPIFSWTVLAVSLGLVVAYVLRPASAHPARGDEDPALAAGSARHIP